MGPPKLPSTHLQAKHHRCVHGKHSVPPVPEAMSGNLSRCSAVPAHKPLLSKALGTQQNHGRRLCWRWGVPVLASTTMQARLNITAKHHPWHCKRSLVVTPAQTILPADRLLSSGSSLPQSLHDPWRPMHLPHSPLSSTVQQPMQARQGRSQDSVTAGERKHPCTDTRARRMDRRLMPHSPDQPTSEALQRPPHKNHRSGQHRPQGQARKD
jgi:hypothetical protein